MTNLDINKKMEFILNVAQSLAERGATADKIISHTKLVAASMQIPAKNFNLKVMPSVLYLNVFDGEKMNHSFRNYENRGVDMDIVNLISAFTLKAAKKNYTPQQFQDVLQRIIGRRKIYSPPQVVLATGLFCGALCILFGGDFLAAVYTAVCAAIGKIFQLKLLKLGVNHFITTAIAAFTATAAAYFTHFLPSGTIWIPIIACALFLIPGIPIINAITESLDGFLLSGMAKAYNSILITISITVGIVFSLTLCAKLEAIDLEQLEQLSNNHFAEILFASIIASTAFSVMLNVPKKILPLMGIFGATALVTKNFLLFELNFSPDVSVFIAATLIGILSVKANQATQAPTQVFTVPAIIPFVPGVLIYRFLMCCIYIRDMEVEEFFYEFGFGVDALQIIFAMTIGVTLPNLIADKFLKKIETQN